MVQENENIINSTSPQTSMQDWFNELIAQITTDKFLLETDTASTDKVLFYNTMMSGNELELSKMSRSMTTMVFLRNLIFDYLQFLNESAAKPIHLALDLSDSKILVWAEIENDDIAAEDNLILTEAKVNSKYAGYGFYISSTIVEKSDSQSVPPHYKQLK
ncbi:hypothetical protein LX64_00106 [Chitinophaga skermanii]|uniref:Uncharacterized protein n=1 Tax=Chitinophaga skermanii TaxID=331697 RepID=A0A327R448_9BACT|nr:hypothetical protein [Chitinophaga skermanii]RAJ10503.1 hypothetical protein LX64_00106 [Chitinophaga skermanii]